ncbi:LysR family transcriptional regulator [Saccharothrix carnea]|uniref:LysR family transcriptional regulator n=1 Tax=Saccharothrix carnea TaxID=1280637 RepID=UPI000D0C99EB|nr:LysR substrate-binding domain-containing protein [Saccharothrix carnea]
MRRVEQRERGQAVLRALAADEHITHAAEAAGVPQPTVSRWLASLSASLGAPVAIRSGRRIRLTRAGRLLCEAADRALTALEAGHRAAAEEVSPERGQVALGFLHLLGRSLVPTLVSTFREHHPSVRFRLVQNSRQDILADLSEGVVDLALVSPPPTDPAFTHAVIREEELILVTPSHRRASPHPRRCRRRAVDTCAPSPPLGLPRTHVRLAARPASGRPARGRPPWAPSLGPVARGPSWVTAVAVVAGRWVLGSSGVVGGLRFLDSTEGR